MTKRTNRIVSYNFENYSFISDKKSSEDILISHEELETLRLHYDEGKSQYASAKQMGISQSQFQRDLQNTLLKLTDALKNGKTIRIISRHKHIRS